MPPQRGSNQQHGTDEVQAILLEKSLQCITTGTKKIDWGDEPNQGIPCLLFTLVSVSTTPEQREALKAAYGGQSPLCRASRGWLMCPVWGQYAGTLAAATTSRGAACVKSSTCQPVPCRSCLGEADIQDIMGRIELRGVPRGPALTSVTPPPPTGAGTAATSSCYILPPGGVVIEPRLRLRGSGFATLPSPLHCRSSRRLLAHCRCLSATNSHQLFCLTSQPQSEVMKVKTRRWRLSIGADFQHSKLH